MEKFFKLKEHGTTVKTEIIAGITTFLSMAYILAVNPSMLSAAGMDSGAVFTATAVSAAFATIIMGVFANYPPLSRPAWSAASSMPNGTRSGKGQAISKS